MVRAGSKVHQEKPGSQKTCTNLPEEPGFDNRHNRLAFASLKDRHRDWMLANTRNWETRRFSLKAPWYRLRVLIWIIVLGNRSGLAKVQKWTLIVSDVQARRLGPLSALPHPYGRRMAAGSFFI